MSQVIGGALVVVILFFMAGLIGLGKKLIHKVLGEFKNEIIDNLAEIKSNVIQVNNAVNHVEEGTPTLSDRVDALNGTLEYTQGVLTVYKKESTEQFGELHKGQDMLRGMIETVKDDVEKIRESVDRRNFTRGNDGK
jgi:methyl-accepting chemotaxis protein